MSAPRVLLAAPAGVNVALLRRALVRRLLAGGAQVHVAVPRDAHFEAVAALGAEVHPWAMARGSLGPGAALASVAALRRIVAAARPQVVHSFTHQPNIFARLAVGGGAALVNSVTGLGSNFLGRGLGGGLRRALFHTLYRATRPRCAALIFQNDDDRAHFAAHGLTGPTPVFMVRGTGVDVAALRPGAVAPERVAAARAALGLEPEHVVLTLAARLIRDKGVFEFLEAARALAESHPRARFLLVGEPDPGNPASLSPQALEAARAGGAVVFAGWREDMPLIWALSDVAVLPSYREGLPVSLQEAAACGLPIVTTQAPGCRDVVAPGESGLLAPVGDAPALARAMAALLDDPALRQRMGQAGRRRAETLFNADTLAGEIVQVYGRVRKEFA